MTALKTKSKYTEGRKQQFFQSIDMKLNRATEILTAAGLRKNVAQTLSVILVTGSTKSIDIEQMTGLRQPEVSVAIRQLRRWNWIDTKEVKKQGKGRPVHEYSLKTEPKTITTTLASRLSEKIENMKNTMVRLRELEKL